MSKTTPNNPLISFSPFNWFLIHQTGPSCTSLVPHIRLLDEIR